MNVNYQLLCDKQIEQMTDGGRVPKLLLHSCCGPCSSYVLEYLSEYFEVDVLFFNPNIFPEQEYEKRRDTQRQIIEKMDFKNKVSLISVPYDYSEFLSVAKGNEADREGGERCIKCFELRLKKTAHEAKKCGYDCFATTLSVSPHKNATILNEIGNRISEEIGITFLVADFKKREGYKRSIELSKLYSLYRQEYCGCEFSLPKE